MRKVEIRNRVIGDGEPVLIIAEAGMGHDGSLGQAKCLVDAAAETGADAIKFQTHIAEAETIRNAPNPPFFENEPRVEYYQRTAFSEPQIGELKELAESKGLMFLSSSFSIPAVDLLDRLDVAAFKIASGEITNLPLLEHVAKKGKPIIISSGMSTLAELREAISLLRQFNREIILMQCSSEYPLPYESIGLNLIGEFKKEFDLPVGLSDHTLTFYTTIAAVALGACLIEKHFTLSKKMYGPDTRFSLTPEEFTQMVEGIRAVETALAHPVDKNDIARYAYMREVFQKSIVATVDIPQGTEIREDTISTRKPGTGLPPRYFKRIIGKRVLRDINKDSIMYEKDIDW